MKYLMNTAIAGVVSLGLVAGSVQQAQAGHRHNNGGAIFAGVVTGLILGGIIAHSSNKHNRYKRYNNVTFGGGDGCYRGALVCRTKWQCFYDDWGNRHCDEVERCSRPLICN